MVNTRRRVIILPWFFRNIPSSFVKWILFLICFLKKKNKETNKEVKNKENIHAPFKEPHLPPPPLSNLLTNSNTFDKTKSYPEINSWLQNIKLRWHNYNADDTGLSTVFLSLISEALLLLIFTSYVKLIKGFFDVEVIWSSLLVPS